MIELVNKRRNGYWLRGLIFLLTEECLFCMEVALRLFATLSGYMPHKAEGNSCSIEVDEGTRVRDLLEGLKIPAEKIKLVFLNGVHAKGDEILKDGDRIGVFPPLGGG